MNPASRFGTLGERFGPAALGGVLAAGFSYPTYVALHAVTAMPWLAAMGALALAAAAAILVGRSLVARELWHERPRWAVAALVLLLIAGFQVSKLAEFVRDPTHQHASVLPASDFITHHSCVTAYHEAARLAADVPNIYAPELYRPGGLWRTLDGFQVDFYEYPPPFPLGPRLTSLLAPSFLQQRAVWFLITLGVLGAACFGLARWQSGHRRSAALILGPTLFIALPVRIGLQMSNFQLTAIGLAVIAMLAFERQRNALGGAALAFAMVSKFFPGVLLVFLLARRRFVPVAWTLAFAGFYALLTLLIFGVSPFRAFFEFHLPRLSSGEAFPMLQVPFAVAINQSVYGVPLKLGLLGVPGMSFGVAGLVAWVYTLAVLGAAWFAARLELDRVDQARLWLCLLGLGALRSPFLPQDYAQLIPLWLLTLLPNLAISFRRLLPIALGWLVLNVGLPMEGFAALGTVPSLIVTAIPQSLHWALLFGVLSTVFEKGRRGASDATVIERSGPAPVPTEPA